MNIRAGSLGGPKDESEGAARVCSNLLAAKPFTSFGDPRPLILWAKKVESLSSSFEIPIMPIAFSRYHPGLLRPSYSVEAARAASGRRQVLDSRRQ